MRQFHVVTIALVALAFAAHGERAQADDQQSPVQAAESRDLTQQVEDLGPTALSAEIELPFVPSIELGPLDRAAIDQEDALDDQRGVGPQRFGVARPLHLGLGDAAWYDLPNGRRVAVFDVSAAGALGLRVHFE